MKHTRSSAPAAIALLAAAACADPAAPPAVTDAGQPAQSRAAAADEARPIPGQYIVVFDDDVSDAPGLARRLGAGNGATVRHVYEHAIKGFSARMSEQAAAALARNPNVAYVEQDQEVSVADTETNATWGIDRIDDPDLPLDGTFNYAEDGTGVTAYIIDTGIRTGHAQFGSRATVGFDAFGGNAQDCNGHGTHVAGTVGGSTYGVAQAVSLVAVRVLDCGGSGSWSGVVAGMDHVAGTTARPAVANMSLSGGYSQAVNDAIGRMTAAGVTVAVAAGNGNTGGIPQNACNSSPASAPSAITVGSTTKTDTESSFSNYGTCVDILAPGSGITSAWYTSDIATNTISGTSMATPHVAGVAALHLGANPGATPAATWAAISSIAKTNTITLHSRSARYGTPNRFLFTSY